VAGAILETLGALVARYPVEAHADTDARRLPARCVELLKKQFGSAKPESRVIAGALECLAACLGDLNDGFGPSDDLTRDLYRVALVALTPLGPRSHSLEVPRAACLLLQRHALLVRRCVS
jgi:hypothetical protein